MKPKVYVTNHNANYDYSSAEAYGEIIYMTSGYMPAKNYQSILTTFENYAKTATENDYLLLSGANLVCALAMAAWLRHHKSVTLLQHGKGMDDNKNPISVYQQCHVSYS
jgi:hypothetical protein